MAKLSHIDESGRARMVDVGDKPVGPRLAIAKGRVLMAPATLVLIQQGGVAKGDVLATAKLAGIMGAKRTAELIPLCHPLSLDMVDLELTPDIGEAAVEIIAICKTTARTGVEMEALTAVTVAALTLYDMCKSIDRTIRITDIRLTRKEGGRSGSFQAE